MVGTPFRLYSVGQKAGDDGLNEPLSFRKVAMTVALIILCLQIMYFLVLPWLPDMEAYVQASSQM